MTTIVRFEDLIAWQKARALAGKIYRITQQSEFSRDFGLARQIQRAAVSIMANVAEGFERRGVKEFSHFLLIAKASCAEVKSHLYLALDCSYIDQSQLDELLDAANELSRIIAGLRQSIF